MYANNVKAAEPGGWLLWKSMAMKNRENSKKRRNNEAKMST